MAADCFSVTCCLDLDYVPGTRPTLLTFARDSCADQIDYALERHTWTRTGLSALDGIFVFISMLFCFALLQNIS